MEANKNLWNDAAKYGAVIGLVTIVFAVLGVYIKGGMLLGTVSLAAFIALIYIFTKRRAALYGAGAAGYSYGKGLVFILCMSLFAGILQGAYLIADVRWINPELYALSIEQSMAIVENMGVYTPEQIESMMQMMHSPLMFLFAGVLGSVLKGLIFGLVIAAFTKRDPDIFSTDNE